MMHQSNPSPSRGLEFLRAVRRWHLLAWTGLVIVLGVSPALAQASRVNISQGYHANSTLVEGTLVVTDHAAANTVKAAYSSVPDDLVGVVVQSDESLLSVDNGGSNVQVATSGDAYALVSNINGDVKTGDRITVSPINGVGMKSTVTTRILGVAQSDLASAAGVTTLSVTDKSGKQVSVKVGRVLVLVNVSYYNGGQAQGGNSVIPKTLQDISNTIAGKQVSPIRIIIGSLLLLIALIIAVFLVYGAVRSSIVSIGRNPLSQPAVRKGLAQVLGFVALILLVTLISIYLILSR